MPTIDIKPPIGGLSDDMAFMDQMPLTTRKALNVRGLDPKNGRRRIAKRSGLAKFIDPDTRISGDKKIQDLASISKNEDLLTYAKDTSSASSGASNVFANNLPGPANTAGDGDCVDARMDDFGDLYFAQRKSGVYKHNQDGELLSEILIPESDTGADLEIIACDVDEFGNVAIATGGYGGTGLANQRLFFFENRTDGTYRLAWQLDTGRVFMDCAFYQGTLFTLEATTFAGTTPIVSTLRVYENYKLLEAPTENTDKTVNVTVQSNIAYGFATRMDVREDGVIYVTGCDHLTAVTTVETFLLKLNPNGDTPTTATWVIESSTDDVSGIGFGVVVGPRNTEGEYTVYTYGPRGKNNTDSGEARRIVDEGQAVDAAGTNSWVAQLDDPILSGHSFKSVRIDTDFYGNYYACVPTIAAAGSANIVEIRAKDDGADLSSFNEALADPINGGTSVAVSKDEPPAGTAEKFPEFVFYGTREAAVGKETIFKQRLLAVTQGTGSMRSLVKLAVSGGSIVKFTATGISDPANGTGVGALDATAPFVMSAILGKRVYFTDGLAYKKYDVDEDAVSDWLATTSGLIPPRCRLVSTWRGRIVIARDPEEPQLWHMSAVGDGTDFDNFPAVPTATQAISGVNAKAGRVPDIVNAMIPWDDDLLLFGGDKSIWRLTGDPILGGQFDLVSDETGMAFGKCWAKDPIGGRLFFFGSRGGVYMMERNSLPVRISRDRIERRLQDVDLDRTYVRLEWNYRDEGLHVIQCPYGSGGSVLKHWFWDAKQNAWWEDQYGNSSDTTVQPTSVYLFDGDAQSDRVLMFGCEDGRIRKWDEDTASDEGSSADVAIAAEVVYGPIVASNEGRDLMFKRMTAVLADDQGSAGYRVYVQDQADKLGAVVARGTFQPGRNNGEAVRFRGPNAWVSVTNATAGQRFAIEDLQVEVSAKGRVRRR